MRRRLITTSDKADYNVTGLSFTGSNYVDTGIKLFDSAKDFTVLISYTSTFTGYLGTIIHALYESGSYQGFCIDIPYNAGQYGRFAAYTSLNIIHNSNLLNTKKCSAIRRSGNTFTLFTNDKYPSGVDVTSNILATTFNTNVLLGAYQTTSGTKGRYYTGTINHCAIYLKSLTDTEIKSLMSKEA